MKTSRRIVNRVRSNLPPICHFEPLELRQLLSTTFPNILPVGDSITAAMTGHASYRYWLWNSLADAGYTVDFVGSTLPAGVDGGPPLYAGFDPNHDGHPAFHADDMEFGLQSTNWKDFATQPQNTPDIALLHIGTNDVNDGQSDTSTRDEIGGIIDALRAVNPNITVLLAQIIPNTVASVAGLNSLLPALASSKNTAQSPVMIVDQATGFDAATDTYDGIHPNEAGEKKIAAKWLAALTPLLPAPTAPPEGVYLDTPAVPLTNAVAAFGPVEYEQSNGGSGTYDGELLTIRGQTFMRGFGVNGPSELDFDLSGATYSRFQATVGVDDEVNPNGSVTFQVFVNNEATPRFSSQTLTGLDAPLALDVDITGATSLRLVVTDAGDGNDFDHADWAQARLIPATPEPPPPPPDTVDAPSAPKCLKAKIQPGQVSLSWKDTSKDESGFRVLRRDKPSGDWVQIAELAANAQSFTDTGITAGLHYAYRVVSFNDGGESHPSNVANAFIKVKKPKHPKGHHPDHVPTPPAHPTPTPDLTKHEKAAKKLAEAAAQRLKKLEEAAAKRARKLEAAAKKVQEHALKALDRLAKVALKLQDHR